MDDLYGKKAKKYKLKYLKLKNEYIAKGGMYGMYEIQQQEQYLLNQRQQLLKQRQQRQRQELQLQLQQQQQRQHQQQQYLQYLQDQQRQLQQQDQLHQKHQQQQQQQPLAPIVVRVKSETHGCVFYSNTNTNKLNIVDIDNNLHPNNIGKLLISNDFRNEIDKYYWFNRSNIFNISMHIPEIFVKPITQNSLTNIKNINCTYVKRYNNINYWGCIIYKNVGITLEECDINSSNIIFILISLRNSIKNFFIPFNVKKNIFHSDLHPRNITYNEKEQKIYFINFGSALHLNNSYLRELTDIYELIKLVYYIFFKNDIFNMKTNFLHETTNSITKNLVNDKLNKNNFFKNYPTNVNYNTLKQYFEIIKIKNHLDLEYILYMIISSLSRELQQPNFETKIDTTAIASIAQVIAASPALPALPALPASPPPPPPLQSLQSQQRKKIELVLG